jgi:hypothetical protein
MQKVPLAGALWLVAEKESRMPEDQKHWRNKEKVDLCPFFPIHSSIRLLV